MAAKKVNVAQAKAARQKKIVIIGSALLAVVLVIQVPRTMKQLKGSSAPAPAPATVPAPLPATPVAGVPTSSVAPAGDKLVSFESFASKDPFVQQVAADGSTTAPAKTKTTTAPAPTKTATTPSAQPTAFKTDAGAGTSVSTGGHSATIQVNGKEEAVSASKAFPKSDPVFKLVSVGQGTAEIAIAGGSFKDGGKTITLTQGKSITLLNTANDKRYTLLLVSTG